METTMSSRNDLLQAYINILIKLSGRELTSRECNTTSDEELLTQLEDTYKEFIEKNRDSNILLKNVYYNKSVTRLTDCFTEVYKSDQDSDGKEILDKNKLKVLCLIIGTFYYLKATYQTSISKVLSNEFKIIRAPDEAFQNILWSYHPTSLTSDRKDLEPTTKSYLEEKTTPPMALRPNPYQPQTLKGDDENTSVAQTKDLDQKAAASPATATQKGTMDPRGFDVTTNPQQAAALRAATTSYSKRGSISPPDSRTQGRNDLWTKLTMIPSKLIQKVQEQHKDYKVQEQHMDYKKYSSSFNPLLTIPLLKEADRTKIPSGTPTENSGETVKYTPSVH